MSTDTTATADAIAPKADPSPPSPTTRGTCCASPRPARWTTASRRWSGGCSTTPSRCSPTRSRPCSAPRSTRAWRRRTCRCWSTACAPSASRASRSTSPTATSPRPSASSCSPTPPGTCSTRATRSPARRPRSWPCCSSTPATASSSRPAGTPPCSRCCASRGWCWRSTRSTSSTTTRRRSPRSRRTSPRSPRSLGFPDDAVVAIPVSALVGDNVVDRSERTPWYDGPTLLGHLESVPVVGPELRAPFRMPVQYVIRPGARSRRAARLPRLRGPGRLGHRARRATRSWCCPAAARTTVAAVDTADGPLDVAGAGRSVTILLADDIDISRGDLLAAADAPPRVTSELETTVCWLAEKPLRPGARLLLKHGTRTTQVIVGAITERLDPETLRFGERAGPAADQRHRARRAADGGRAAGGRLRGRPRDGQLPAHRPADGQHAGRRAGRVPARRRPGLSAPGPRDRGAGQVRVTHRRVARPGRPS